MKHIYRGMTVIGLIALTACETGPTHPGATPPVRSVQTSDDRLYVACVARDPFFTRPECKAVRGRLGYRQGR